MINSVVLVGRLANDPEMRYSSSGTQITKFRIAVSRPPRAGSDEEQTDWLNVVCFGKTAEFVAQYLDKGSLVGIEGRIQTSSFDGQDGKRQWWTEIAANSVQALESRQEAERRRSSQPARQAPQQQAEPAPQQQAAPPPEPFGDIEEDSDPFGDQ